jgi:hypothetical protein
MLIVTGNVNLVGVRFIGNRSYDTNTPFAEFGSVVRLTGTVNPPFILSFGSRVDGLTFFWPNQVETGGAPITYPPLFSAPLAVDIDIIENTFVNAFDVMLLGGTSLTDVAGRMRVMRNRGFVLRRFIEIKQAPDVIHVAQNAISIGYFATAVVGPTFALRDYAADNAEFIRCDSAGAAAPSVDGLTVQDNFCFGIRFGVRIVSGRIGVSRILGNQFDGVATGFSLEGTANMFSTHIVSNEFYGIRYGDLAEADTVISLASTASAGEFVFVGNGIYNSNGHGIVVGSAVDRLQITGNTIENWGSTTGADVERFGISVDCVGSEGLIASNKLFVDKTIATSATGISIANCGHIGVYGNQIYGPVTGFKMSGGTVAYGTNGIANVTASLSITGGTLTNSFFGPTIINATGAAPQTIQSTASGPIQISYKSLPAAGAANNSIDWAFNFTNGAGTEKALATVRVNLDDHTNASEDISYQFYGTAGGAAIAEWMRLGPRPYFPLATTTASAANAFLNSGSSPANELMRSTSALRYKRDVEPMETNYADAVLKLKPIWYRSNAAGDLADPRKRDWSYFGLGAEDVAAIEPRFVFWGYHEDDFKERVEITPAGAPIVHRELKLDAEGNPPPLKPDGVMYDRLTVALIDIARRQDARLAQLEAEIAELR